MSFTVLFGNSPLGVEVRVRNLSGLTCAANLDAHQEGDPDSGNDARHDISVSNGEKETLNSFGFGSEKVVESGDRGGERRQGDAFGHCESELRPVNGFEGLLLRRSGTNSKK